MKGGETALLKTHGLRGPEVIAEFRNPEESKKHRSKIRPCLTEPGVVHRFGNETPELRDSANLQGQQLRNNRCNPSCRGPLPEKPSARLVRMPN